MSSKRLDHTCFRHNLRRIREMSELTQEQLAEMTGLQPAAISHFETGERQPSLRNLVKLCLALDIRSDDLVTP
jgi:transcriptional regulator with XRE-family HTH domain